MDATLQMDIYNQGVSHGIGWIANHPGYILTIDWEDDRTIRLISHPDCIEQGVIQGMPKNDPFSTGCLDAYRNAGIIMEAF